MNEALYDAVFSYGENKIDPFAQCCVDFDRIISDMRLVGYEINSLNIVQQIMLEQLDTLLKFKGKIIEQAMDLDNRDDFCREKYGLSFKDIDALDPIHDIEYDIKSGQVIYYLTHEAKHKEEAYFILFKKSFDAFTSKTGFNYISN
ncbi:MAG: hypothetical protein J6I68_07430 [Butyrivibrio sp.]|uniref:hypothetical protein n=1 Tax=Butyrivibrio sp. TaxID=28121 RepID=UPI001B65D46A|nr:hypothetical protein [Butyrivibrio sp.]MBE5828028.1 hypothetical protein [Butyrivibrio sp.]MBP3783062.1 hypothetical protein [Butyrivibrio sp.]